MPISPTPVSTLPVTPDPSDRGTFSGRAVTMFNAIRDVFTAQVNAIADVTNSNAALAELSAAAAAASVIAAAQAQANSELAAANAASAAGAAMWVSGTSYLLGAAVWSLSNKLIYRRIVAGAGTTDPSGDATNWALVGVIPQPPAPAASNIYFATNFGGF